MTSRVELKLEPEAEAEFLEAAAWYTDRGPELGTAFRNAVSAVLEAIEETPTAISRCPSRYSQGSRSTIPYVVYYVVQPDAIAVIAIIHGRRDPRRWTGRR